MTRILFVCHGNICRSPMAEYICKHLVREGHGEGYRIDSVAVSREEIGNDVYPPARRVLAAHGVPCPRRQARQVTAADMENADYVLCMDHSNLRRLAMLLGGKADKARLLGDFGLDGAEIEDPWYTDNFEKVYDQIDHCCRALLAAIK